MDATRPLRPHRLFLLVLALLLLTASAGRPFAEQEALVAAGDAHLPRGEFTFAREAYRQADFQHPNRPDLLLRMGEAAEGLHLWEEAGAAYEGALRYPWTEARAAAGLARVALAEGDTFRASKSWARAIDKGESDPTVVWAYARYLWQARGLEDAAPWLERLLTLAPAHSEARYYAGIVALWRGHTGEAREHLRLASVAGSPVAAHAKLLLRVADSDAISDARDFVLRAGVALLQAGETKAARLFFQRARDLDPKSPVAEAYLGYSLLADDDGATGRGVLREVRRRAPDYPLVWYFLGEAERMQGHIAEARDCFLRVLELDPENSGACAAVAGTYMAANAFAEAEPWLYKAVELAPDDGRFWLSLAQYHVGRMVDVAGNGLAAARKAAELLPDDPAARDTLGWALFLTGDVRGAQAELERAAALESQNAAVQYHLGSVYYALGDRELARYHLTRALDAEPQGRYCELAKDLLHRIGD